MRPRLARAPARPSARVRRGARSGVRPGRRWSTAGAVCPSRACRRRCAHAPHPCASARWAGWCVAARASRPRRRGWSRTAPARRCPPRGCRPAQTDRYRPCGSSPAWASGALAMRIQPTLPPASGRSASRRTLALRHCRPAQSWISPLACIAPGPLPAASPLRTLRAGSVARRIRRQQVGHLEGLQCLSSAPSAAVPGRISKFGANDTIRPRS